MAESTLLDEKEDFAAILKGLRQVWANSYGHQLFLAILARNYANIARNYANLTYSRVGFVCDHP